MIFRIIARLLMQARRSYIRCHNKDIPVPTSVLKALPNDVGRVGERLENTTIRGIVV
jgi:hypothetical protein